MSTTSKSVTSIKEARELYDLKQRAAKFYAENGVPQKMEEVLNSMFYENPSDVYGHLVNFFQGLAKAPTITKVKARPALDGKGQMSIQTDIFCVVNNQEQLVYSSLSSSPNSTLPEVAKPEELEEEAKDREKNLQAALKIINTQICTRVQGLIPSEQAEIDAIVSDMIGQLKAAEDERLAEEAALRESTEDTNETEKKPASGLSKGEKPKSGKGKGGKGGAPVTVVPDEPKEKMLCGSSCISATSQAACCAGALISGLPLYEYIGVLRFGQGPPKTPKKFRMPLPMVTIFQGGRAAPGKSSAIKEYMLVPKPGKSLRESIPKMIAVYNDICKAITTKNGVAARNVTDTGALMIPFDRPEQGIDMIQESMTRLGFTAGEDLCIALNLAGHEIFDYDLSGGSKEKISKSFPLADKKLAEKGKYEIITGQQKLAEDMVEYWAEFLDRYPAVIAIIDPLRKQEDKQWMMLCEKISEKCYILGEYVWHRPGLLKGEELSQNFRSSGVIYKMQQMTTVTDIVKCAAKMEAESCETVLSTNVGETTDFFLADMAVGMKARFIKIGGPCRGERVAKLNRLLAIEAELHESDRLLPHENFTFPKITVPPPPVEEMEVEPEETEHKDHKDSPKKK